MTGDATDPMAEITAMKAIADALSKLDTHATSRVLQWAASRFGVAIKATDSKHMQRANVGAHSEDAETFESFADLFSAASPSTDADRALVAGYWSQFVLGEEDFASQAINTALKNLGHGVSNITKALETLKAQNPSLVMQVRKAGTSQQARKKYKLTAAGKKAVELLIGQK